MVLTRDQELWGIALWVEKNHGESGPKYVASQIERLALEGDEAGLAMWRTVAERTDQLRQTPESDRVS
jgi:hypothetical protein